MDTELMDTIASATAACALVDLAAVIPNNQREAVREKIYDTVIAALHAFADLCPKAVAEPSLN